MRWIAPTSVPTAAASDGAESAATPAAEAISDQPLDAIDPQGVTLPGVEAAATGSEAAAATPSAGTVALADASDAARADALIVGLTAPLSTKQHDVSVIGASWDSTTAEVQVDVRVEHAGVWGDWESLSVDTEVEGNSRPGSEPYVVAGGQDVQVRLTTADGSVPTNARLDVFGGDVTGNDLAASAAPTGFGNGLRVADASMVAAEPAAGAATAGQDSVDTSSTLPTVGLETATRTPMPSIHLRAAWGAVAPFGAMDVGKVNGVTVHHTAGTNDYSAADVPAILRGVQHYHMAGRGWSDIGYNFLIDRFGGIWEGRFGGILKTTKGVHASNFNGVTSGVSVMGNFEGSATVTTAIKNALASLIAWKLALHGVGANGSMTFDGVTYPVIVGHRDVPGAQTACPGKNLYSFLPTLRIMAAQRQVFPRELLDHDLNGDSAPDVIGLGTDRSYLGTNDPLSPAVRIGSGWNVMDMVVGSPSLLGGKNVDLIYREAKTGRLSVYHGDGTGGFSGKTVWGLGWKAMSAVIAPGDWTGDGNNDLIAVEAATGNLYLYRGDGKGHLATRQLIGHGWKGIRSVSAAGDLTGDGRVDLVAIVDGSSELRLYPGNGSGGFQAPRKLGSGFYSYDVVVSIGDTTGDGSRDLFVRNAATGRMLTLAGTGTGSIGGKSLWGSGWDKKGALVAAPNWNGDGRPVLITFDRATGRLYSYSAPRTARFPSSLPVTLPGTQSRAVVGDVTDSGTASVVTLDGAGVLALHAGRGDGTFAPARTLATGWQSMLQISAADDFDHDGVPDLLTLSSSGALSVYPFAADGSGTLGTPYAIGRGFAGYRVIGVGGWSRSTSADVLAISKSTGQVRWYVGHARGGLKGGTVIASGWGSLEAVALGNVMGSGNNDLFVRDTKTGRYWIYPANGTGGFSTRRAVSGVSTSAGGLL